MTATTAHVAIVAMGASTKAATTFPMSRWRDVPGECVVTRLVRGRGLIEKTSHMTLSSHGAIPNGITASSNPIVGLAEPNQERETIVASSSTARLIGPDAINTRFMPE